MDHGPELWKGMAGQFMSVMWRQWDVGRCQWGSGSAFLFLSSLSPDSSLLLGFPCFTILFALYPYRLRFSPAIAI